MWQECLLYIRVPYRSACHTLSMIIKKQNKQTNKKKHAPYGINSLYFWICVNKLTVMFSVSAFGHCAQTHSRRCSGSSDDLLWCVNTDAKAEWGQLPRPWMTFKALSLVLVLKLSVVVCFKVIYETKMNKHPPALSFLKCENSLLFLVLYGFHTNSWEV